MRMRVRLEGVSPNSLSIWPICARHLFATDRNGFWMMLPPAVFTTGPRRFTSASASSQRRQITA